MGFRFRNRPGSTVARNIVIFAMLATILPARVFARSATPAPALPAPSGTIVNVSSVAQLQSAVQSIASNTTIVIAPGTYRLTNTLYINGTFTNVALRGSSNDPNLTVLVGPGMTNASYGNVPYGIWTGGNVKGLLVANLTLRDFYYHDIIFNGGTQSPRVYNLHLLDAGQQLLKSPDDGAGGGVNAGIVEYSTFEYTTTAPTDYTNGIDVHTGANWIIRHNLFRNIVSPPGAALAGPAVLMWHNSTNTLTEGNTFLNCARAIAYGLIDASGFDHAGGIIRNNFIYRASNQPGDVGIGVADSPNTQVVNNTVVLSGTYGSSIEYRYAGTTGVVIKNNLIDGLVQARSSATGTQSNNVPATANMFVNAAAGDLHLVAGALSAIDHGATLSSVTDDWDGEARPAGNAYDVGADEIGGATTTYSIGGRATDSGGAGVTGITVTLSGSRSLTAVTDASGAYSFSGLAKGGDYTLVPSKAGYTFTPAQLTYSALATNQTANFSATSTATAPTVSLTAPVAGSTATAPATIAVSANASTSSGTISKVDFYAGTSLIGSDSTAPYSITWSGVAAGSYSVTARATNSAGLTATSAPVAITVNASASLPSVSLTAPAAGATFSAPASITVSANASTTSGTISKVDFFAGATLIGTDTTSPYSVTWSNVAAGTYSVTAQTTTSAGVTATSAAASITVTAVSSGSTSGGLLKSGNVTYVGAFRVPALSANGTSMTNGGAVLTYNPQHNSLYVGGHPPEQQVAEFSIPTPATASGVSGLPTATVVKSFFDPTGGKRTQVGDGSETDLGGLFVAPNGLISTAYVFYDANGSQKTSHFLMGSSGSAAGPYALSSASPRAVAGYMTAIPAAWQAALGGSVGSGQCCIPITSSTSSGPALSIFNPADVGVKSPVPSAQVLGYPLDKPLPSQYFNLATQVVGAVLPDGSSSALFIGTFGAGTLCYGATPSPCNDPTDSDKGYHAYPYVYQVWAYDLNDLAAVKAGTKQASDLRPYATWTFTLPFNTAGRHSMRGVAFDPATKRIFVSIGYGDGDRPLIHVLKIQ